MIQFLALTGAGGGQLPFQRESAPQTTSTHNTRDNMRLRGYEEKFRFFAGIQWSFQREEGDPLVTLNYSRAVVQKIATWMVGRGIRVKVPKALQAVTKPIYDEHWKTPEGRATLQEIATSGGIAGDCWVLITPKARTPIEQLLSPNSRGGCRINVLLPHQCFPVYDPLDRKKMLEFRIIAEVFDDTQPAVGGPQNVMGPGAVAPPRANTRRKYIQIIRPETITRGWMDDQASWVTEANILGEIPVVHIKNEEFPGEPYGLSDLDGIVDVQRELNEKATDLSDAVNYHASPVTIVTGAKAKSLEKGPKTLWSIPAPEARVSNLQLGDMGASHRYLEFVQKVLFDLSGIPEGSLGRVQPISNTSAAALQVQFQPLLEKVLRKSPHLEGGLARINYFILRYVQLIEGFDLPVDFCASCGGRIIETPYLRKGKQVYLANGRPRMQRKCYHANPLTLDFLTPEQVRIKIKRAHSYGFEVREVTMKQAKKEIEAMREGENPSAWDVGPSKAEQEKEQEKNEQEAAEKVPPPDPALGEPTIPQEPPKAKPAFGTDLKLPAKDIDLPEEPETVNLLVRVFNPETREWSVQSLGEEEVVPTGCERPVYLNPYESVVTLASPLPRDRVEETNLWTSWKNLGLVSRNWIRERMDEDLNSEEEDERIADDIRFYAALDNQPATDPYEVTTSQPAGPPQGPKGVAQSPGMSQGKPLPGKPPPPKPPASNPR